MAVGPYVGIQVQNHLNSKTSFMTVFAISVAALVCVSCCRIKYPKVQRKKFALKDSIYKPALPFMCNMMFLMIPYGAVIAYSSILAQEKGLTAVIPYFYICLVAGMLTSKLSTQRMIDAGRHRVLVYASLVVLVVTMASYVFLNTGVHLLIAGYFFGLGYGILQPLFQSFVTGTTPTPKRGVANATYLLSYDIGIGIGALLMGFMQETIGLTTGFALTAIAYVVGGIVYMTYVEKYYHKLRSGGGVPVQPRDGMDQYMERQVYAIGQEATVREAITYFSEKHISGAPVVSAGGQVVGFLSDGDIMRYLRTQDHALSAMDRSLLFLEYLWDPNDVFEQKLDAIMDLNVLELGTRKPITIPEGTCLADACRLLSEAGVKKVPVVKGNAVVGIISRSGITNYLIRRYLERKTAMEENALPQ